MNESRHWKWIRAIEGGQVSVLEVQDQEAGRKTGICALVVEVVFLGGVGDLSVGGAGACMHENGRGRLKRNDDDEDGDCKWTISTADGDNRHAMQQYWRDEGEE